MPRRRSTFAPALAALLVLAGSARAGERELREAKRHHDRGVQNYNIGRFDQAIEEFEKAYELDPDPLLLFNLAKANVQKGDNERAIFFYRRYLQMSPEAPDRDQVLKKVADLERAHPPAPAAPAAKASPPPAAPPPGARALTSLASSLPPPPPPPSAGLAPPPLAAPAVLPEPSMTAEGEPAEEGPVLRLAFSGGAALPRFSGRDLDVPLLASLRAMVGASIPAGEGAVDLGGALALVPIPYRRVDRPAEAETRSYLFGIHAAAGYRVPLPRGFSLGGELDAGVAVWSGLDQGNPFTTAANGGTGTQTLPTFRLAAALFYRVSRPLWFWAGPSYQIAVPMSGALKDAVSAVHLVELAAGLAVQP